MVNFKKKGRGRRGIKKYVLDLVLLNVQFLLFYPLQLGLCVCESVCVHVCVREGERKEGLFHISHDTFCLGL